MPACMINLEQSTQGEQVIYIVAPSLDCVDFANLVIALLSAWSTSFFVTNASALPAFSQLLSNPLGIPLNPSEIIIPSLTIRHPLFFSEPWRVAPKCGPFLNKPYRALVLEPLNFVEPPLLVFI